MEENSAYVPPKYVPIRGSDAEDLGSVDEGQQPSRTLIGDTNQWSSGICACFDDPRSCCLGTLCPCVLFGKNAESLGSGTASGSCTTHCLLWGLLAGVSCILTGGILLVLMPGCTIACCASQNRRALREKYNLPELPCNDCCTHLCCHMCALCQENREIHHRSAGSGSSIPAVSPPEVQTMQYHASHIVRPTIPLWVCHVERLRVPGPDDSVKVGPHIREFTFNWVCHVSW